MDSGELIELFYNRTYEKFVNKQILDDKNYIVPRQQLINYVYQLLDLPLAEFIDYIREHINIDNSQIKVSDITQISTFSSCEIEMCNALLWANNPGLQFVDIGRLFPDTVSSSTIGAYRKYGENHIKASSQLGLTFEYYDYWYLSCIGYIYPELNENLRRKLLARTITRNKLYQKMLLDILSHDIRPESYMYMLSDSTIKRRVNNVCFFLNICLEECRKQNIKVFSIVREIKKKNSDLSLNLSRSILSNSSSIFRIYLKDISNNYVLYSEDEKTELFKRYKKGDTYAYTELVKSHLPLVLYISKFYKGKGVSIEDLIQEGNIGLLKAIEHFDYSRRVPFKEYAKSWIIQTISVSMTSMPYVVRLPLNQLTNYRRVKKFINKFEQDKDYLPSITDIEDNTDLDLEIISYLKQLPSDLKDITCLVDDMDIYESPDSEIEDYEEKDYCRYQAWNYIRVLNKRYKTIIKKYFGIGYKKAESMTTIADEMGYTRERVRQIITKSIKIMRETSPTSIIVDNNLEEHSEDDVNYNRVETKIDVLAKYRKSISGRDKDSKLSKNEKDTIETKTPLIRQEVNELKNIKVGDVILYKDKLATVTKIIIYGGISRLVIKYENNVLDDVINDKSKYTVLQSYKNRNVCDVVKELSETQTENNSAEQKKEALYNYYIEKISKMRQGVVKGEKSLAKPALLLAVIDGISEGKILHNDIVLTKWLEEKYSMLLLHYSHASQILHPTGIEKPFWHLQSDGFWHLKYPQSLYRQNVSPTKKWILDNVECARLDDDLWSLLQNDEWREKICKYIIDNKLTHKKIKIENERKRVIEFPFLPLQFFPEEEIEKKEEKKSEKKEEYPKKEKVLKSEYDLSTPLRNLVDQKIITKVQLKHCRKKGLNTIGDVFQIIEKYHLTPDSTRFTKYTIDIWFAIVNFAKAKGVISLDSESTSSPEDVKMEINEEPADDIEIVYVDIPSADPYIEFEVSSQEEEGDVLQ